MSKKKKATSKEKTSFEHLLSPTKIGPIDLKNRIVLSPMNEVMSGMDGAVTEQQMSYFAARAKGGCSLLTVGAIMGTKMASNYVWGRNLQLWRPGHLQGLDMLNQRIHYFGAKTAAQMSIGFGRQGHSEDHNEAVPAATAGLPYEVHADIGPKSIQDVADISEIPREFTVGQQTREMTIAEIQSEQKEYAKNCQMAVVAGFDMIEIHAPHGYLEHSFLSPLSNKRTDMYGGEWRNRKRFLVEVAEQIRYVCPGVAVGVRISAEEHLEGGLSEEEMIDVAQDMEKIGLDYISLSDGGGYTDNAIVPDIQTARHIPEHGEAFKKALNIPVVVASQHSPKKAEANVAAGKFDLQALGRQLFVDPEYANKLMEGRPEDIVRCDRCNNCLMRCLMQLTPACPKNQRLGREYTFDEYKIGEWDKGDSMLPEGIIREPVPSLKRPWWKKEVPHPDIVSKLRGRMAKGRK